MDALWIMLGATIIVVAAIDTFTAVLSYNERGLVVNVVARATWGTLRGVTRRLPPALRPRALRMSTALVTVSVIVTWVGGVILGFALIYFGAMGAGAIKLDPGAPTGFFAALYMSIGQFSTVGVEDMHSAHPAIDFLTVLEALSSVMLLGVIVSFLMNIFNGIQMLRSLCADVGRPVAGDRTRLSTLYPMFPGGQMTDLERWLTVTWGDLNLYGDVLRQTRSTYYFQSGDDQFAAPFALGSMSEIIGALRWGLPVGSHPVSILPGLFRVEESLAAARSWIDEHMLRLSPLQISAPVTEAEFARQRDVLRDPDRAKGAVDPLVREFDELCRAVARLVSPARSDDSVDRAETAEMYRRYVAWLPFGHYTAVFDAALARDLDYQPTLSQDTVPPFDEFGVARALPTGG